MSAGDDKIEPGPLPAPDQRAATVSALSWLARWLGIPFLLLLALYYAEPLFRGTMKAERVPMITRQEVHPYPFPEGATGPNLAPPDMPRRPRPITPVHETPLEAPVMPAAEIVAHPLDQPQPRYPTRALEQEREGIVRLRVTIAPDGSVSDVAIVSASSPGWFEEAAMAAVRRWHYRAPGRTLVTEAEIEFKLR